MFIFTHAWTDKHRDEEQHEQKSHVPNDRTESNDGNSQKTGLQLSIHSEGLDEEVTNDEQRGETNWPDDLSNDDSLPWGPWYIAGKLFRWKTQSLSLETGDSRS